MAKADESVDKRPKYSTVYPWEEWFRQARKKGGLVLRKGIEYQYKPHSMVYIIRDAAKRHGIRVFLFVGDDNTTLTVKWKEDL